jgi:PEP-CTERM motif
MSLSTMVAKALLGLAISMCFLFSSLAHAGPVVIYTWTTTGEGFGTHISEPTSATFEVPLSDVLSGVVNQGDITDIQLTYPGLTFDTALASSVGLDAQAFVDPTTGAFIFHDVNQGLAVIASQASDPNTFLSITVDSLAAPPSTTVADQFNALNDASPFAGFPTAGFWTATFPTLTGATPEPAIWAMMLLGFGLTGANLRARRRKASPPLTAA